MAGLALWQTGRSRILVLAGLIALGLVSYMSFDTYIRPRTARIRLPDEHVFDGSPSNSTEVSSPPPTILLVSAFFPSPNSKHTIAEYRSSLTRFLGHIDTDVYIFVPPEMESLVREVRGSRPLTVNTTFASPFGILPLEGLEEQYADMRKLSREKKRHSTMLYAARAAKAYFLDEAVQNSGQRYQYAFWTDAQSFRGEHTYVHWPDARRLEEIWDEGNRLNGMAKEDLVFVPMWDLPNHSMQFWQEMMGPLTNDFSEGSFFGGPVQAVSWWRRAYYAYHDAYLSRSFFIGEDQAIINALVMLHPSRFITVWPRDLEAPAHGGLVPTTDDGYVGNCGPLRSYYRFWLASPADRKHMRAVWDARWHWDSLWRKRATCRVTRVLGMQNVLERDFGPGWHSPPASIDL